MRFSVVTQVLAAGAVSVSAAAVSQVETVPFTSKFPAVSLKDILAAAPGTSLTSLVEKADAAVAGLVTRDDEERAVGCSNPAVRVEWRNMAHAQRVKFVQATRCLMDKGSLGISSRSKNLYEDLVWVHQQATGQVHNGGVFLPWHRYYTHLYSRLLREECGFTGAFPWWDETRSAGNFAGSGLFTNDYFGALPPVNSQGQGTCLTNGAFANRRTNIGPGMGYTNRCLARGENRQATSQVSTDYFNYCQSRGSYDEFRQCLEYGPHAYGHNGMGPTMADPYSSPSDPIFFMHHAFIDRFWKIWQNKSRDRWTTIGGCASQGNPCPTLTLDTVLSSRGIRADVKVRDVLDTENAWLCYKYDY